MVFVAGGGGGIFVVVVLFCFVLFLWKDKEVNDNTISVLFL